MTKNNFVIREIKQQDNAALEKIIKAIFPEFNMSLVGTAYEDFETTCMFESYQESNEIYFVLEVEGIVLGGGGIKPLRNFEGAICELQKMYFSPKVRGMGFGKLLFEKCMEAAKQLGYKQCYLESAPQLEAAIYIYEKNGFKHLDKSLGDTGHYSCSIHMLKDL